MGALEGEVGLVRVPRAWGSGGDAMAAAAYLPLPFPEVAVIAEETIERQSRALAAALPERPLVLGGCCCAHVGAVAGLAARLKRVGVVWLDAHGDLNTPATSPSGNAWGMPLRMLLDGGELDVRDVVLIGARDLDPPERAFIAASGLRLGAENLEAALVGFTGLAADERNLEPLARLCGALGFRPGAGEP
jgi:arginase family enzyme